MTIKKRYIALIAAVGIGIGWLTLGGTAAVMHYTSSTDFCVSCHTMEAPTKSIKVQFTSVTQQAFEPNVPIATFQRIRLTT